MTIMKTIVFASLLFTAATQAEIPETFQRLWNDPAVAGRIDRDIEKHRKGDATIKVIGKDGKPLANATVEVRQQAHEFLFGCNLFVLDQLPTPELNAKYECAFTNLFNFATLPFYWRDLEPEQGKHRFAEDSPRIWRRPPPDRLVKWCKANGITPKGHALMYAKNKFMPDWTARTDAEAFRRQGAKHMAEIAARYKRDIPIWDAVNEEIPRRVHFQEWHAVPDDYLAWCFQEAGRLFPKDVKLMINDGQLQAHYDTYDYMALVKELLQGGVRVEGIGMQFHVSRDSVLSGKLYVPAHLQDVYSQLGRLGLPLYITEITIPGVGENGAELQAAIVANLYRLWFSTPMMAGVTWWNLGDGTAYENENKALGGLLDKEMNPKPAYRELDRLINHEWKTRLTLTTDANGKASFRGFHGTYGYTTRVGSKKVEGTFCLQRGAKNQVIVQP
ncbi:MAG: endo-1,4-beta-xylanase [Verrucomicrobia bacterium]|nr:endo-1,4-beta-xylanase [Verrucomicrobiota bacterium]